MTAERFGVGNGIAIGRVNTGGRSHAARKQRPDVRSGIAEIPGLSRSALAERWARIYGRAPPRSISRRLLEYAAAYDLQAREHGGLDPAVKRKLRRAAAPERNAALRPSRQAKASTPAPGSRLIRDWGGRTHTVDVLEGGFLYDGRHYRSLSEIARAITGARWSGPRFFGRTSGGAS